MFKCKQACAFQFEKDGAFVRFELGKTYTKEELAGVPKEHFKGEDAYFVELSDKELAEVEKANPTTTTSKKSKKTEDTEEEDKRV